MKKILIGLGVIIFTVAFLYFTGTKPNPDSQGAQMKASPTTTSKQWDKPPEMASDSARLKSATIETSKGLIRLELFPDEAPKTVNNFAFLAREKFYDGVPFHRIIKDFMVQTGDPTGTGTGGPGYKFDDEKVTRNYARGTIAMANSGPNTNGSQFFIMTENNDTLPKSYTIFGRIVPDDKTSFATLDAIAGTPVEDNGQGEISKPKELVTIKTIVIEVK